MRVCSARARSGGGTAAPLMDAPFFRQLGRLLSPAGVLAVNYFGGKGPGLKEAWCRLRLVFDHGEGPQQAPGAARWLGPILSGLAGYGRMGWPDCPPCGPWHPAWCLRPAPHCDRPGGTAATSIAVRAFADVEKSRVRNHVLFAAHFDLGAANLTAAVNAAAARQTAAEAAGGAEVFDPLQLRLWRALGRQEVQLTYDRQRCLAMLRASDGAPRRRAGQMRSTAEGEDGGTGKPELESAAAEMVRQRQRQQAQQQQQPGGRQHSPPWAWRQLKALRERHALAVSHFVAMRTQFADSLWLS